jgi:hypothetical protein
MDTSNIYQCLCRRTFLAPGSLDLHARSCPRAKRQLSGAFAQAKEALRERKRQRTDAVANHINASSAGTNGAALAIPETLEIASDDHQVIVNPEVRFLPLAMHCAEINFNSRKMPLWKALLVLQPPPLCIPHQA